SRAQGKADDLSRSKFRAGLVGIELAYDPLRLPTIANGPFLDADHIERTPIRRVRITAAHDQLAARLDTAPANAGVAGQGCVVLAHRLKNPIAVDEYVRKDGFTGRRHARTD